MGGTDSAIRSRQITCPSCKAPIPAGQVSCPSCGAPVPFVSGDSFTSAGCAACGGTDLYLVMAIVQTGAWQGRVGGDVGAPSPNAGERPASLLTRRLSAPPEPQPSTSPLVTLGAAIIVIGVIFGAGLFGLATSGDAAMARSALPIAVAILALGIGTVYAGEARGRRANARFQEVWDRWAAGRTTWERLQSAYSSTRLPTRQHIAPPNPTRWRRCCDGLMVATTRRLPRDTAWEP
jgi:hypothetical protein